MSGNAVQLALTVGLTKELVSGLSRFQDISVVPCHLARQPAGAPQDPIELVDGLHRAGMPAEPPCCS